MARFFVGGPAGLTVNARCKRVSDGYFWNGSTSAWQVAAYDNAMTHDSDMLFYVFAETHADFVKETMEVSAIVSGASAPSATFVWPPDSGPQKHTIKVELA